MTQLIAEIYVLDAKIAKTVDHHDVPRLMRQSLVNYALSEELKMTNEIEGIASTRKEINELLFVKEPHDYYRFYGLFNKYRQLQSHKKGDIHTAQDMRNLYDDTLVEDIKRSDSLNLPDGKIFRSNPVHVFNGNTSIHDGLMPEETIITTLDQSLAILNDTSLPLLYRVPLFHYLFGYIHPFYDGNGRLNRLISALYLSEELNTLSVLQLSISIKKHQHVYYDAFKQTNDIRNRSDLTSFVLSFLSIFKDGLQDLLDVIQERILLYRHLAHTLDTIFQNDKQIELMQLLLQVSLFNVIGLSMKDLEELTNNTRVTINTHLNSHDNPYLQIEKQGRQKFYSLNIDALMKSEEA